MDLRVLQNKVEDIAERLNCHLYTAAYRLLSELQNEITAAREVEVLAARKDKSQPEPAGPRDLPSPCLVTLVGPTQHVTPMGLSRNNLWLVRPEDTDLTIEAEVMCLSDETSAGNYVLAHRLPDGSWVVPCI
jgi:hypothetical protein